MVTGANKGIGFEIVKKLSAAGLHTILACRNLELGSAALKTLQEQGFDAEVRELDISDQDSVRRFAAGLESDYGRLDILVNNAAIAFKNSDPTPFVEQAKPTIHTNYHGTVWLTQSLLPLLRRSSDARIVNVSSRAGLLKIARSKPLRDTLLSPELTVDTLNRLMDDFVKAVQDGTHMEQGWPNTCYGMSKLGVTILTQVLSRQEAGIAVNACCPGWCATDMSSHGGNKTAEEGARTPALLATMADRSVTGKFYCEEADFTEDWAKLF